MVNQIVKLDPMAAKLVDDSVGGRYEVVVDDWRNAKSQIAQANTTMNVNLGFSFAVPVESDFCVLSKRLLSGTIRDIDVENNRSTRNISEYSLQLNGVNHPSPTHQSRHQVQLVRGHGGDTRQHPPVVGFHPTVRHHQSKLSELTAALERAQRTSGLRFTKLTRRGFVIMTMKTACIQVFTPSVQRDQPSTPPCLGQVPMTLKLNVWGQFQATLSLDTRGDNIFTYRS